VPLTHAAQLAKIKELTAAGKSEGAERGVLLVKFQIKVSGLPQLYLLVFRFLIELHVKKYLDQF
jgi:hypothetical protein